MPLKNALVIGGGIGGMSAAICLRRLGIDVDLIEIDPQWRVQGAGITLSPATFRAMARLGMAAPLMAHGYCADGVDLHDVDGNFVHRADTPRLADPGLPSLGGILRPVLREVLSAATLDAGVHVRLGVTFKELQADGSRVRASCSDGRQDRYDLVIGADGLRSQVRRQLFPDAPAPIYTGQACWRAVLPRPADVVRPRTYMGIREKAGVNPVSANEMYLYLNNREPEHQQPDETELPRLLAQRLAHFGGLIATIRDGLGSGSRVLYRPLDQLVMPAPWYRGRVLLIGDAVHATTPHMASGAGIAVEDALALAEELSSAPTVEAALQNFMARRYQRCRSVVEYSVRLGQLEQQGGQHEEHLRVQHTAGALLAAEY